MCYYKCMHMAMQYIKLVMDWNYHCKFLEDILINKGMLTSQRANALLRALKVLLVTKMSQSKLVSVGSHKSTTTLVLIVIIIILSLGWALNSRNWYFFCQCISRPRSCFIIELAWITSFQIYLPRKNQRRWIYSMTSIIIEL